MERVTAEMTLFLEEGRFKLVLCQENSEHFIRINGTRVRPMEELDATAAHAWYCGVMLLYLKKAYAIDCR